MKQQMTNIVYWLSPSKCGTNLWGSHSVNFTNAVSVNFTNAVSDGSGYSSGAGDLVRDQFHNHSSTSFHSITKHDTFLTTLSGHSVANIPTRKQTLQRLHHKNKCNTTQSYTMLSPSIALASCQLK